MLGWWLGKGNEETRRDGGDQEPPETPAPVFAARAFKSALFGTPAPPSDDTYLQQTSESASMPAPKQNAEPGVSSPLKPQGILMTPGTARSRKTVSFGATVKGQEARPTSTSGIPDNCPGKFPSPWVSKESSKLDGRSLRRTALTKTLENVRDTKRRKTEEAKTRSFDFDTPQSPIELDSKTSLTAPQMLESSLHDEQPQPRPRSRDTDDFDGDVTIDLNEPHSQSGRYWKSEYEKYNEDAKAQMKKLVRYKQLAKSYAKKKDEEAIDLGGKLKEAQERALQMEDRIAELIAHIADGCLDGIDEDSPTMMKNLARQTALAVQYRSQVDQFRDALKDRDQKKEAENGDQFAERQNKGQPDVQLKKSTSDLMSEVHRLRLGISMSEKGAAKLREENAKLSRELEKANEKLRQSEKRRQASDSMSQNRAELLQGLQTNYDNLKESAKAQRRDAEHLLKRRHEQVSELKKEIATLKDKLATLRAPDQARGSLALERERSMHDADTKDGNLKIAKAPSKSTSQAGSSTGDRDSIPQARNSRNSTQEGSKPYEIYEDLQDRETLVFAGSALNRRKLTTTNIEISIDESQQLRSKSDALAEIGNNKTGPHLIETRQAASDLNLRERFAKLTVEPPKRDLPSPRPLLTHGLRRTASQKQAVLNLTPSVNSVPQEISRSAIVRRRFSGTDGEGNRSSNLPPDRMSSITSMRSRTALDPERAAAAKARLELRNAEKRKARESGDGKENVVM